MRGAGKYKYIILYCGHMLSIIFFSRFYELFYNMDAIMQRSTIFRIIQVRMVLFLSVDIHESVELFSIR
jgi:hypothetical protein